MIQVLLKDVESEAWSLIISSTDLCLTLRQQNLEILMNLLLIITPLNICGHIHPMKHQYLTLIVTIKTTLIVEFSGLEEAGASSPPLS